MDELTLKVIQSHRRSRG